MVELSNSTEPKPKNPVAVWETGKTYFHLASHNRYQVYEVLKATWDPDAIMGAGGWIYQIHFTEYSDSHMSNKVVEWEKAQSEITLPVHNLTPW